MVGSVRLCAGYPAALRYMSRAPNMRMMYSTKVPAAVRTAHGIAKLRYVRNERI